MSELLSDLAHGAMQVFGVGMAAYWVVRLAIRHEVDRGKK